MNKEIWQKIKVNFTIEDIGAPLITNLAQGLYSAPAVVREYIQNAVDSYVKFAEEIGDKPSNQVRVDVQGKSLHIFDDGIGMNETDIQNAKKIAVSDKPFTDPESYVGFRGIGIWAGLAACESLIVKTSRCGDKFMYRLIIDFEEIAKNSQNPISIKALLDPRVHLEKKPEKSELHYTHVELQDITAQYEKLLDAEYLKNIIVETCPARFDPEFEYGAEIQRWLEEQGVNFYEIFFQGTEVFRDFPKKVSSPRYKELEIDGKTEAIAWGCINSSTGKLDETGLERRNMSLRIKNFAVGGRGIYSENAEKWRQLGFENIDSPQNLDWYAGEVYILNNNIIPDTPREKLEDSHQSRKFIGRLREYYNELTTDTRVHSEEVNARKDLERAKEITEKLGTVNITALTPDETLNMEREVSALATDLEEDERLATRKLGKSEKPHQKKIKAALSKKQIREERAVEIKKLRHFSQELRKKLGVQPNEPTESQVPSQISANRSRSKTSKQALIFAEPKGNSSQKETERLLQSIFKIIENVLGIDSEEYSKICSQVEDLFRKKGLT